jgi:hypothetical protein
VDRFRFGNHNEMGMRFQIRTLPLFAGSLMSGKAVGMSGPVKIAFDGLVTAGLPLILRHATMLLRAGYAGF